MKEIILICGVWLVSDGIFSLRTYWKKEDLFCQLIRWTRLVIGIILMIIAILN